jgi:hypothetical protein
MIFQFKNVGSNRKWSPLAILGAVGLTGCGSSLTAVNGIVTVDDKPVANAIVAFAPKGQGSSGAGTTNAEGKYTISSVLGNGLPEGSYKITVMGLPPAEEPPPELDMNSPEYRQMMNAPPPKAKPFKDPIPTKYHGAESGLSAELAGGNKTIDLPLKSN